MVSGRDRLPRRTKYLWVAIPSIMAAALWLTWLLSVTLGERITPLEDLSSALRRDGIHIRDLGLRRIGGDFQTYYLAGEMMAIGQSEALFGPTMKLIGPYLRPPFYAWLFVPFGRLPYVPAAVLWMAISLGCLWLSMRLLVPDRPSAFSWALTFMPTWAVISFGQSEALSLLLLCLVYRLWRQERLWLAGLVCSILLYKFPLLLGVVFLWVFDWKRDWRALGSLMLGGGILAGISLCLLPEASAAYLKSSGWTISMIHSREFPIVSFFSTLGFWLLLLPGHSTVADSLYLLCAGLGTLGFFRFWSRHRTDRDMVFAGAVCVTILASPYNFIYDWTILLLPAALIWKRQPPGWRESFAVVWLATFCSRFLTGVQLSVLPFAVQVCVPALAFAAIRAVRALERQRVAAGEPWISA